MRAILDVILFRRTVKAAEKSTDNEDRYAPSTAWAGLIAAVERLTKLAQGMKHWANRDIQRITTQIESICKKIQS